MVATCRAPAASRVVIRAVMRVDCPLRKNEALVSRKVAISFCGGRNSRSRKSGCAETSFVPSSPKRGAPKSTRTPYAGSSPMFLSAMNSRPRSNTTSRITFGPRRGVLEPRAGARRVPARPDAVLRATASAALAVDGQALVADLEGFDGDLVGRRVQRGTGQLARPAAPEVPAQDFPHALVHQDDGPVGAPDRSVHRGDEPVPEREVAGDAALQDDVRELREARDLPHRASLAAVAILDHGDFGAQPGNLPERAAHRPAVVADALDHDLEQVRRVGIVAVNRHGRRAPRG